MDTVTPQEFKLDTAKRNLPLPAPKSALTGTYVGRVMDHSGKRGPGVGNLIAAFDRPCQAVHKGRPYHGGV
jgi:hypothetical protein